MSRSLRWFLLALVLVPAAQAQWGMNSRWGAGSVYVSGHQPLLDQAVPLQGRALVSEWYSPVYGYPRGMGMGMRVGAVRSRRPARRPSRPRRSDPAIARLRAEGEAALERGDSARAVSCFARALSKSQRANGPGSEASREISLLLSVAQKGMGSGLGGSYGLAE